MQAGESWVQGVEEVPEAEAMCTPEKQKPVASPSSSSPPSQSSGSRRYQLREDLQKARRTCRKPALMDPDKQRQHSAMSANLREQVQIAYAPRRLKTCEDTVCFILEMYNIVPRNVSSFSWQTFPFSKLFLSGLWS